MARIRTIKPEFPQSESMGRVSRDARLLFIELWTICDDSGKARASSRMLASLLFPYDDDAPSLIDGWLGELEREGCIVRYDVDGSHYLRIEKWQSHQKVDHPSKSLFPDPRETVARPREILSEDQGPRTKEGIGPLPPVSPPSGGRSERNKGKDGKDLGLFPASEPEPKAKKPKPRGTRWPDGQSVPDEWISKANTMIAAKNLPTIDVGLTAIKFINWALSTTGRNGSKLDWERTWANFVLEECRRAPRQRSYTHA